jgi:hypothetical protein
MESPMNKQKLDVTTLVVSSFEPQKQTLVASVVEMTGTTGFCNTCVGGCDWTV